MSFDCCKFPTVKKYFLGAETKSGKKVQLTVNEETYKRYLQIMKEHPEAKLIIEE